jgi:hypothetical protein
MILYWMKKSLEVREVIDLLSRDCDGCSQMIACNQRFRKVMNGEKVYCPDGTAHLVDSASKNELLIAVKQA